MLLASNLGEYNRINVQFSMLSFKSRTFRNPTVLFGIACHICLKKMRENMIFLRKRLNCVQHYKEPGMG